MLKTVPPGRLRHCLRQAESSPQSDASIGYPAWYLRRWHFLPEGYLSRRSVAGYDACIRRVYSALAEAQVHRAIVSALRRVQTADLLEIGCGPGHGLAALRRAFPCARLTGVDLSPFMLERAEQRIPPLAARLVHADAARFPWAEGSFDGVVAAHLLGHVPLDVAAAIMREAARLLRLGGVLVVADHPWHPSFEAIGLQQVSLARAAFGFVAIRTFRRV
ncbi:MAG: class I SAM-dependent methyltransferase [Chloroflexi bacterium]|nr:class I SAM-dependent methyltransferase [Chloroflexota bacterium]